ncbi:unnamed protein product [Protopolystoma xenopodis]|uniref:Uncharacterized protein n=1 Tax=Protopolystoma xenopodis TaxID=117903 RepID=A0A3S5AMC1_9PLAT|nr:unnamed protein product [Protopolystoma xenopodis]
MMYGCRCLIRWHFSSTTHASLVVGCEITANTLLVPMSVAIEIARPTLCRPLLNHFIRACGVKLAVPVQLENLIRYSYPVSSRLGIYGKHTSRIDAFCFALLCITFFSTDRLAYTFVRQKSLSRLRPDENHSSGGSRRRV